MRRDHRDPNTPDLNDRHIDTIKFAIFYLTVTTVFDAAGFGIFMNAPSVPGFAMIVVLAVRTSAIYVLSDQTMSHKVCTMKL